MVVVWQDTTDGNHFYLYYKNLATGTGSRVSWTSSYQTYPAIVGQIITWADDREVAGSRHIYYKNIVTDAGSRTSWTHSQQIKPVIGMI